MVQQSLDRSAASGASSVANPVRRDTFTYEVPTFLNHPDGSDTDTLFAWLHYQLDCMVPETEIFDRLVLLGSRWLDRLQGGAHACFSCMQ
jgi:hypothetical protein